MPRRGQSKYDWDAIRADAKTLTTYDLVEKYEIPRGTIDYRRSEDKLDGNPWPMVRAERPPAEQKPRAGHVNAIPARLARNLEAVPEAAMNLPWTRYPRDADTARTVAAMLAHRANDPAVIALGTEAVAFFETHAAYLRALAERNDKQTGEPSSRPVGRRMDPKAV